MILFRQADVYAPEPLGKQDLLVAGTRITAVAPHLEMPSSWPVIEIDARGLRMLPGLIDAHVHLLGGGGEGGPATRTRELELAQLREAGITTVVGCLGTDGFTRHIDALLMKAKGLRDEGVSAYIFTGSYQMPPPTLLGDVARDLALVDEILGVGEVAIADHRSSGPTVDELVRLGGHVRVGGMLGGKAGVVHCHMGDGKDPFRRLYQVAEQSEIPLTTFWPTHCNRNPWILEDAKAFGRVAPVDLTTSSYPYYPDEEIKPSFAARQLLEAGVPLENITMTSDACGSLPSFDAHGNLVGLASGEPRTLLDEILALERSEGWPFERALTLATTNVARILRLKRKGRVLVGYDADLCLLDAQGQVEHLVACGELLVRNHQVLKKGTFER